MSNRLTRRAVLGAAFAVAGGAAAVPILSSATSQPSAEQIPGLGTPVTGSFEEILQNSTPLPIFTQTETPRPSATVRATARPRGQGRPSGSAEPSVP